VTSIDGVTWILRCSPTEERLRGIAFGNGRFVAVGYEGAIIVSPTESNDGAILSSSSGVRWSSRHSSCSAKLEHLEYFDGLFKASDFTRNVLAVSANGRKWTPP